MQPNSSPPRIHPIGNAHGAPVRWMMISATGFVLAVAAVIAPDKGATRGFARFVLDLPHWLSALSLIALTAAAMLLILPAFLGIRRRHKSDEEHEHEYQTPKLTASSAVAIIVIVAVLLSAPVGFLLYAGRWAGTVPEPGPGTNSPMSESSPQIPPSAQKPPPEGATASSAVVTSFVSGALIALGLGALAGVIALYLRPFGVTSSPQAIRAPMSAVVEQAVSDSLADIRQEPDPRTAVLRIYRHFERSLARAKVARPASETPLEFLRTVLLRLRLPEDRVRALTQLFEIARFSNHQMGERERERAWQCLRDITVHLDAKGKGNAERR